MRFEVTNIFGFKLISFLPNQILVMNYCMAFSLETFAYDNYIIHNIPWPSIDA